MTAPDFASFDVAQKGRPYDEFEVGQVYDHHWGRTLTEYDNVIFSTATCNWNPMHLNVEHARRNGHPSTVLNPMLLLCVAVGLSVEDLSESGGAFLSIDNCIFRQSAYPGDTLTASSTVLSKRPSTSRPQNGIVTWHTTANNQHGDVLLEFDRTNLIARTRSDMVTPRGHLHDGSGRAD